jgi:hypothetical protein
VIANTNTRSKKSSSGVTWCLLEGHGAPAGVQVRKFYPSTDQSAVICLWEGNSVNEVREYVDAALGDSSDNMYFEVDAGQALGLPEPAIASA